MKGLGIRLKARFKGLGFRAADGLEQGIRVQGLGFRVKGLGFGVKGLGIRFKGLGFRAVDGLDQGLNQIMD